LFVEQASPVMDEKVAGIEIPYKILASDREGAEHVFQ
jgi:hypothetical protein